MKDKKLSPYYKGFFLWGKNREKSSKWSLISVVFQMFYNSLKMYSDKLRICCIYAFLGFLLYQFPFT
nr:MAG TPA: hypothetical protein [Caudoviricetes sp.]